MDEYRLRGAEPVACGQTVALTNQSQFVFAAIMAYVILGETPSASFYPAVALIVAGAAIVITAESRTHRAPAPAKPSPPVTEESTSGGSRR